MTKEDMMAVYEFSKAVAQLELTVNKLVEENKNLKSRLAKYETPAEPKVA